MAASFVGMSVHFIKQSRDYCIRNGSVTQAAWRHGLVAEKFYATLGIPEHPYALFAFCDGGAADMKVSTIRLFSVRDVWLRYPAVEHGWPTWKFLVVGGILVIGDLADHRCLLVLTSMSEPNHSHLFRQPGVMKDDYEALREHVKAAGSFRITREGVLAIQDWSSQEMNIATPPEVSEVLSEHLQSAIQEHALPWTPHIHRWAAS